VVAQSKTWFFGRSLTGIAGSNPAESMDGCLSLMSAVSCQVQRSLRRADHSRRSSTGCECDREASIMRRLAHYSLLRHGGENYQ